MILHKYDAIRIIRYCRFGNNIYQLHNAIAFARYYGIQTVYIDDMASILDLNPMFQACVLRDGLRISAKKPLSSDRIMAHKFFYPHEFNGMDISETADSKSIFAEISKHILQIKTAGTSNYIHAHIRSGDIFVRRRPKINYTQPPLAFYQKAVLNCIASGKYKGVVVCYEDDLNPVSLELVPWLNSQGITNKTQSSKFKHDFANLITARCLIAGKGSLIPMIACLSGKIEKLCVFREVDVPNIIEKCSVPVETYIDLDGMYIGKDDWQISGLKGEQHNQQLKQLISYPMEQICIKHQ